MSPNTLPSLILTRSIPGLVNFRNYLFLGDQELYSDTVANTDQEATPGDLVELSSGRVIL